MSSYVTVSTPITWIALGLLVVATGVYGRSRDDRHRRYARLLAAGGWSAFAAMWTVLVPHYALVQLSLIEAVGAALAVPAAGYAAYEQLRGHDEVFALARAIGIGGLLYLPFVAVPALRELLIETVVVHTEFLLGLAGYSPPDAFRVVSGAGTATNRGYRNSFAFVTEGGHPILYHVKLACTGVKSMATFVGVVYAVDTSTRRRLRTLLVVLPTIYGLNLLRNAFIAIAFGHQRLHVAPELVLTAFGIEDPYMVSYLLADRVIAQSLSLVALLALAWLAIRTVPEILDVIDTAVSLVSWGRLTLRS